MEIQVSAKPHMLLETVELMYAWANRFPLSRLTADAPCCPPEPAVGEMMEAACGALSREDPVVRYYFAMQPLPGEPDSGTCIARNIVYNVISVSRGSISQDCDRIRELRLRQRESKARFSCLGEYRMDTEDFQGDQRLPLEEELARVKVDPSYRRKLLEVFSDFDGAVSTLQDLIAPVAARLEPLLNQWALAAEPVAEQWRAHFREPGAPEEMMARINLQEEKGIEALLIQLRYLPPRGGHGMFHTPDFTVHIHMGLAVKPSPVEAETFTPREFRALRLLGNEDCMRMLRAMLDQPMSSRELSRLLNIPLGTVCRNVSSLYNSRLLIIETVDGWKRYRTNMKTMALLCKHMMELEKYKIL